MKSKNCLKCGKKLKGKQHKFCCSSCRSLNWNNNNKARFKFKCECCKKIFGNIRRTNTKKQKWRFCSVNCANQLNGKYKIKCRTRRSKYGYISVWKPNHPKAVKKRMMEHRLVMEKKISRYLKKGELVHHINYLEWDNRPINLYLVKGNIKHLKLHGISRYLMKDFITEKGLNEELTNYIISKCIVFRHLR